MTQDAVIVGNRTAIRFKTDTGTVWAIVRMEGASAASIDVYDEAVALSARGEAEGLSERTLGLMDSSRNRYGTRVMLKMMREVVARFPVVRSWSFRRVTGARPYSDRTVRV